MCVGSNGGLQRPLIKQSVTSVGSVRVDLVQYSKLLGTLRLKYFSEHVRGKLCLLKLTEQKEVSTV